MIGLILAITMRAEAKVSAYYCTWAKGDITLATNTPTSEVVMHIDTDDGVLDLPIRDSSSFDTIIVFRSHTNVRQTYTTHCRSASE